MSELEGIVTRRELGGVHDRLRAETRDPRAGVFGPESLMWTTSREAVLILGGGRALLLQLAHPFVAHAVAQHSELKNDPLGRFQRTFAGVFGMVFGDLDTALERSRAVHAVHTRVRGSIDEDVGAFHRGAPYAANQIDALRWVHATLLDTTFLLYERIVRPMSLDEKNAAYAESRRFASLFGIAERVMPRDWPAFEAYFASMIDSDTIRVGAVARELAKYIFRGRGVVRAPLYAWLGAVTTSLLPERLRREFGYESTRWQRAVFESTMLAARVGVPLLPASLRYVPAYNDACRRIAGKDGPDRVAHFVEKVVERALVG
jgi:uncharacterized protein (DUF2236 family)